MIFNRVGAALIILVATSSLLLDGEVAQAQASLLEGPYEVRHKKDSSITAFPKNEVNQAGPLSNSEYAQLAEPSNEVDEQKTKIRLAVDGEADEWIVINRKVTGRGVILSGYHTTRVKRALLSGIASGVVDFSAGIVVDQIISGYEGPVPVPGVKFHRWRDHEVRSIVFTPNSCQTGISSSRENQNQSSCKIFGAESITIPNGTDLQAGLLTIEYVERELIRSVTFQMSE